MNAQRLTHRPVRVASVDEEDERVGRCPCGADWSLRGEVVRPALGTWVDELRLQCEACGERRSVRFDIGSFFIARPGIWTVERRSHAPSSGSVGVAA